MDRPKQGLPKSNEALFSPRRLLIVAALAAGIVLVVYAFGRSPAPRVNTPASNSAVQNYLPAKPGSHVLTQSQVGVMLKPGYDGRITINGIPIPEDEMDGVVPTDAPTYDPKLGLRPNHKSYVAFTPGPGKVFTRLPTGAITIAVRFWLLSNPEAAHTITWQLSTT